MCPTLTEIQKEVKWRYNEQDKADHIMTCICGECGETANYIKKITRALYDTRFDKINGLDDGELIEEVRNELPDIIFYIAVLANHFGIDLDNDWIRKMKINSKKYGVVEPKVGYPE